MILTHLGNFFLPQISIYKEESRFHLILNRLGFCWNLICTQERDQTGILLLILGLECCKYMHLLLNRQQLIWSILNWIDSSERPGQRRASRYEKELFSENYPGPIQSWERILGQPPCFYIFSCQLQSFLTLQWSTILWVVWPISIFPVVFAMHSWFRTDQDSKDANDPRKDKHTDNTLPGSRVFLVR